MEVNSLIGAYKVLKKMLCKDNVCLRTGNTLRKFFKKIPEKIINDFQYKFVTKVVTHIPKFMGILFRIAIYIKSFL